jgi:hypothetical protein
MSMLEGFRFMRGERGIRRTRRQSINDEGHTKFYLGSRPLGGGSLHPASNLVYDHSYVYRGRVSGVVLHVMYSIVC